MTSMGVGAQIDFPKNDLKVAWQINRVFCPNKDDLQKKKAKVFTQIDTVFLYK